MGIRGFHKYSKQKIPGSHKFINMMESFKEYREKTGKDPVVIINVSCIAMIYQRQNIDDLFGCRYNIILRHFESFLEKLKNANVQLIFPFHKRNLDVEKKLPIYVKRVEENYLESCDLVEKISKIKNVEELRKRLNGESNAFDEFKFWFHSNNLINFSLFDVCKKYGKLVGTSATPKMHYTFKDHAQLAEEEGAFAILGFSSHYLIHGGNWKYWCVNDLDFETMEIAEYDREAIHKHLGLTQPQMSLFVVLCGCDLFADFYIKRLRSHFRGKQAGEHFFTNVAKYIAGKSFPLEDGDWEEIAKEVVWENRVEQFAQLASKYYRHITADESDDVNNQFSNLIKNDFSTFAWELLMGRKISVYSTFLDHSKIDMPPFCDLYLPLLLKTAGLVVYRLEGDKRNVSVFIKRRHKEAQRVEQLDPIFPEYEAPDMRTMVLGDISDDEKINLLRHILGLDVDADYIKSIPTDFLFILLTLNYLLQTNTLTKSEALGILETLIQEKLEPIPDDIDYPENTDERAFRVCIVFVKMFKFLQTCASVIGFRNFEFELKFDAVYYQKHFVDVVKEADDPPIHTEGNLQTLQMLGKVLQEKIPN